MYYKDVFDFRLLCLLISYTKQAPDYTHRLKIGIEKSSSKLTAADMIGPSSLIDDPAPDDVGDSDGASPMTVITSMPDSSSPTDSCSNMFYYRDGCVKMCKGFKWSF